MLFLLLEKFSIQCTLPKSTRWLHLQSLVNKEQDNLNLCHMSGTLTCQGHWGLWNQMDTTMCVTMVVSVLVMPEQCGSYFDPSCSASSLCKSHNSHLDLPLRSQLKLQLLSGKQQVQSYFSQRRWRIRIASFPVQLFHSLHLSFSFLVLYSYWLLLLHPNTVKAPQIWKDLFHQAASTSYLIHLAPHCQLYPIPDFNLWNHP